MRKMEPAWSWMLVVAIAGGMGAGRVQVAGGKRLEFEVASVRENKSDEKGRSNFPLNPGPQFSEAGGVLTARHMPLLQYVVFAYAQASWQIAGLRAGMPGWARETSWDIDARAAQVDGRSPTKDEMRAMIRALLEERFGMKVHREDKEMAVFYLEVAREGKTGPQLRPHAADDPECRRSGVGEAQAGGYPHQCGATAMMAASAPGLMAMGGRNVTMDHFVLGLTDPNGEVNRPVLNRTGLAGGWDVRVEYAAEGRDAGVSGPGEIGALREQLGLKLVAGRGPVEMLVVDRVERPGVN